MLSIIQFLNLTIMVLWPPVLCEAQSMQGTWRVTADRNGTFGVTITQWLTERQLMWQPFSLFQSWQDCLKPVL